MRACVCACVSEERNLPDSAQHSIPPQQHYTDIRSFILVRELVNLFFKVAGRMFVLVPGFSRVEVRADCSVKDLKV